MSGSRETVIRRPRVFAWMLCASAAIAIPATASAQPANESPSATTTATTSTPADMVDVILDRVASLRGERACTAHCFTLESLELKGKLQGEPLVFTLRGVVLAHGDTAVPLMGTPNKIRIENVMRGGLPVPIGFENDHYYAMLPPGPFVLEGRLRMGEELSLTLPGPLNTVSTEIEDGRVAEGNQLSGLMNATLHFERGNRSLDEAPARLQISRAIRVDRQIQFEYVVDAEAGHDIGVLHLSMQNDERVVNVEGAVGWKFDAPSHTLTLPTSGHAAHVTVQGTLSAITTLSPDPLSSFEWWMFESDAEHRVHVTTEAKQMDIAQSPITRTQPNARLYLVQKGQSLSASVQTLRGGEVLAAVIGDHDRYFSLTDRGDLIAVDTLSYNNNGIDYLPFAVAGRPIYLGTNGEAEKVLFREDNNNEVMIPLQRGSHTVRMQSVSQTSLGGLFGRIELPVSRYNLPASRSTVTVGVPANLHVLALSGGTKPMLWFTWRDLAAIAVSLLTAWMVFRGVARRALGTLVFAGLWFVSPIVFAGMLVLSVLGGVTYLMVRGLKGTARIVSLVCTGVFVLGVSWKYVSTDAPSSMQHLEAEIRADKVVTENEPAPVAMEEPTGDRAHRGAAGQERYGNVQYQAATNSTIQTDARELNLARVEGVRSVQMPLPRAETTVSVESSLVTPNRPFRPVLYYVTDTFLWLMRGLWGVLLGVALLLHRDVLRGWFERVRARFRNDSLADNEKTPAPVSAN